MLRSSLDGCLEEYGNEEDRLLSVELLPEYFGGDLVLSFSGGVVEFEIVLLFDDVFVIEALPPYFEAILSIVLGVSGGSRLVDLA